VSDEKTLSMEQFFSALEEKVEGLSSRVKELASENARLKGALIETAAERDRLKKGLEDSREATASQTEIADKVSRYEAERDEVRRRIERLLKGLEETEVAAAQAAS
jgi:uncharacterized coiled-coil DUF342 family protein